MRLHRLALLAALVPVAVAPGLVTASAAEPRPPADSTRAAARALEHVQELLTGVADGPAGDHMAPHAEGTMALVDLFQNLDGLDAADRRLARTLFARPDADEDNPDTSGVNEDPDVDLAAEWTPAEAAAAQQRCDLRFCLHWVPDTAIPAGSRHEATPAYADATFKAMANAWDVEVDGLGYDSPDSDGATDADGRIDVYLSDTLTEDGGAFGYAMPEDWTVPEDETDGSAYGYLVLDNDMAEAATATNTADELLRVTAAHEFFHLVQFAYDVVENPWLMESTATWMEEQVHDEINDNLRYLKTSSMRSTWVPLDTFGSNFQYGNWVFHQLTSDRWGPEIVRTVWERAATKIGNNLRSAMDSAYRTVGSTLANEFLMFTAASLAPSRYWQEGATYYPAATMGMPTQTLGTGKKTTGPWTGKVDHLAALDFTVKPDSTLTGTWKFRLKVDGPSTGNTGYVMVVYRDGTIGTGPLTFDSAGNVTRSFPFSVKTVSRIGVSLGNSTTANDRAVTWRGEIWR